MEKSNIEEVVLTLAKQVAENRMVDVIGVNVFGKGKGRLLRVTIDKEGGVTLDDCAGFSRELDVMIEEADIVEGPYNLEVSSPGLNRPLTGVSDFERNTGRLVRVITSEKIDNQSFFVGRITAVSGNILRLEVGKREVDIPIETISKAKLEIEIK